MNKLQKITRQVPEKIAQIYQKMSQIEQELIQFKLTETISLELEKRRQKAIIKLSKIMDQASDEAEANGLNPEILEKILANE